MDKYEIFFSVVGTSFISILIYAASLLMLKDGILIFLIASLISVAGMMNLGNNIPTAKEVFWGWIIFDVLFMILALYGGLLVWIF